MKTPSLFSPSLLSHKGQNGRLLIIGGSKEYTGAPFFSLLTARRFVDLLYFYPAENIERLITAATSIPEVILVESPLFESVDCALVGVGLGNAYVDVNSLSQSKRLVVDGDGLKRIKGDIPKNALLTPHEGEFAYLFGIRGTKENVQEMARKHNCTILKKDPSGDIISNGKETRIQNVHHVGLTKGGTGDVLASLTAALFCKNDAITSAYTETEIN